MAATDSPKKEKKVQVLWTSDKQYRLVYSGEGEGLPVRDTAVLVMFALSLVSLVPIMALNKGQPETPVNAPWTSGVIYEIDPYSFSYGHGIQAIALKLPFIKSLGVSALRLNPLFPRTSSFGITDYETVDPHLGSLDELEALIKEAHALNLRLILDLVPNHSSTSHPWFKTNSSTSPYYLRSQEKAIPNNWVTESGESSWSTDDLSDSFHYHHFDGSVADFNWRNPDVQQAFKDIMSYWLNRGVDGFFMWHVNYLVENADLTNNEPPVGHLMHGLYTQHQAETLNITRDWLNHIKAVSPGSVLLLDLSDTESMLEWPSYQQHGSLINNYFLSEEVMPECGGLCIQKVIEKVERISHDRPFNFTRSWALGSSQLGRVTSKHDKVTATCLLVLQMTLPGVANSVNGDELLLSDEEVKRHAAMEDAQPQTLAAYKTLVGLRREPAFHSDRMNTTIVNEKVFSFVRYAVGKRYDRFLIIVNLSPEPYSANYTMKCGPVQIPKQANIVFSTFQSDVSPTDLQNFRLESGNAVVFKFPSGIY